MTFVVCTSRRLVNNVFMIDLFGARVGMLIMGLSVLIFGGCEQGGGR